MLAVQSPPARMPNQYPAANPRSPANGSHGFYVVEQFIHDEILPFDNVKVKHLIVSHLLKKSCNMRYEYALSKTQEFTGSYRE